MSVPIHKGHLVSASAAPAYSRIAFQTLILDRRKVKNRRHHISDSHLHLPHNSCAASTAKPSRCPRTRGCSTTPDPTGSYISHFSIGDVGSGLSPYYSLDFSSPGQGCLPVSCLVAECRQTLSRPTVACKRDRLGRCLAPDTPALKTLKTPPAVGANGAVVLAGETGILLSNEMADESGLPRFTRWRYLVIAGVGYLLQHCGVAGVAWRIYAYR